MSGLFPYEGIREVQSDLIAEVTATLQKKQHLIAHAPTGLGKTVATLAPALELALKGDIDIFFLTSRHTQHQIAIQTLREIKQKYCLQFSAVSIIGKKAMCPLEGIELLQHNDFSGYCKLMREHGECRFYENTMQKGKHTVQCRKAVEEIGQLSPLSAEDVMKRCANEQLCPYEISLSVAAASKVVVADYYHLFNPPVMEHFFAKTGKKLENSVVIVDEGHNLPVRIRELLTTRLSTLMLGRAAREARETGFGNLVKVFTGIRTILDRIASGLGDDGETLVKKEGLEDAVKELGDYDTLIAELMLAADAIRETKKRSAIGLVAGFLEDWQKGDAGFSRILSMKDFRQIPYVLLTRRCLDPSLLSGEIIRKSYSTILMSGTLTPTAMYRDILGFPENTVEREFRSPFPHSNRLVLIVPKTTTRYSMRSDMQYRNIAAECSSIVNLVPGCCAVFFPSYYVRDSVSGFLNCAKTLFTEKSGLSKEEKHDFLEEFKRHGNAVLLGVAAGSFGEGIDLPDILKAVVVVGLPLDRPNLETKELIKYYDCRFGRGWDYGYVLPAITRGLQNAGRCIRSETDRGVLVFLDERYAWPGYRKCFPPDWKIETAREYKEPINRFFAQGL